ncbi:MAG TPA: hypothetical protein VK445_00870 [Dissulfurispiraceae bacterium]|nr:hypothetical protein [Dissulfurispiraceae bacterium]
MISMRSRTVINCSLLILLFMPLSFTLVTLVSAAPAFNMNATPDDIIIQMKDRLNLTADQVIRIKPIIEDNYSKRQMIIKDSGTDRKSMSGALQQLQMTTDLKLGQVLSKEQLDEYQRLRIEKDDSHKTSDGPKGKGGKAGGLRMH